VCWHRNPNDVVADMMEDDSMANQFQGRYTQTTTSEKYCDSMGVLEIFKPPEGFCPNLYFLGVWKCLFRGFVFEICQIGVLIF